MAKFILHTDGGARGNPGPAGAGVVILNESGDVMVATSRYLGDKLTNNEAEYLALIWGLDQLSENVATNAWIEVRMDSELVVKQMRGEYKVKEARLKELWQQAKQASAGYPNLSFTHVRREQNARADALANEAMDDVASK